MARSKSSIDNEVWIIVGVDYCIVPKPFSVQPEARI